MKTAHSHKKAQRPVPHPASGEGVVHSPIATLREALSYMIAQLHDMEKRLDHFIPVLSIYAISKNVKNEINKYADSCEKKLFKIERVFDYLSEDIRSVKNEACDTLVREIENTETYATPDNIRDILILSGIRNIMHYKRASYQSAMALADALRIHTVSGILHDILQWEEDASERFLKVIQEETGEEVQLDHPLTN